MGRSAKTKSSTKVAKKIKTRQVSIKKSNAPAKSTMTALTLEQSFHDIRARLEQSYAKEIAAQKKTLELAKKASKKISDKQKKAKAAVQTLTQAHKGKTLTAAKKNQVAKLKEKFNEAHNTYSEAKAQIDYQKDHIASLMQHKVRISALNKAIDGVVADYPELDSPKTVTKPKTSIKAKKIEKATTAKKRGRPAKAAAVKAPVKARKTASSSLQITESTATEPKRRGRPPKATPVSVQAETTAPKKRGPKPKAKTKAPEVAAKRRGRPPKVQLNFDEPTSFEGSQQIDDLPHQSQSINEHVKEFEEA